MLDLSAEVVQARFSSGAMTIEGFEHAYIAPRIDTLRLALVSGQEEQTLSCRYIGRLDGEGLEQGFLAEVDAADIAGPTFDTVHVVDDGAGGLTPPVDLRLPIPPLDITGADTFALVFAFVLHNVQLPKSRFSL